MASRKFTPLRTDDADLSRVQDEIAKALNPALAALGGDCAARYITSAASFTNGAAAVVNFDARDYDTDGAVAIGAGWRFTVPGGKGGIYLVSAVVSVSFPASTDCEAFLTLRKNGTDVSRGPRARYTTNAGGEFRYVPLTAMVRCVPGDVLAVSLYQLSGGTRSVEATAASNHVEIARIGA